jgi:hypothetical protein
MVSSFALGMVGNYYGFRMFAWPQPGLRLYPNPVAAFLLRVLRGVLVCVLRLPPGSSALLTIGRVGRPHGRLFLSICYIFCYVIWPELTRMGEWEDYDPTPTALRRNWILAVSGCGFFIGPCASISHC